MAEHPIPEGWEIHDQWWFRYQEQLAPGAWLLCFTLRGGASPDGHVTGWVNVCTRKWIVDDIIENRWLEDNRLDEPCGFLEVTCMMHEMRNKYKSP